MEIIFILSPGDSIVIIKSLFEIARWLKQNRGAVTLFYVPRIENLNILPRKQIEIRWLKEDVKAREIPEADIIISTDLTLLRELSQYSRGELIYLNKGNEDESSSPESIKIIDFDKLKPGLPERLFLQSDKKRDKVVISGEVTDKRTLEKIIMALEKVAFPGFPKEVIFLGFPQCFTFNTHLEYLFAGINDIDIPEILDTSFYLIYLEKDEFPILPYWAMAAGVVVLDINGNEDRSFPLHFNTLDPVELALTMIRVYKLGQYRNNILVSSQELVKRFSLKEVGKEWADYLVDVLSHPQKKADSISKPIYENSDEINDKNYINDKSKSKEIDIKVDLVIINYNTLSYLKDCIKSIKDNTDIPYQIIVVDNGSKDGSKEYLRKEQDIKFIDNQTNYGYARACNQGIYAGQGEYIVLLNSDIVVTEGWLEPLIKIAEGKDVAVVGPKMVNKEGLIVGVGVDSLTDFHPRGWKETDGPGVYDQVEEVISVGGACYLIKRSLLPILGLFDEGYFFYFEELDYSLRAREKGYKVFYCPDSKIIHHHEGSLLPEDTEGKLKRNKYFNESRKRFYIKWNEIVTGGEKRREPGTIIFAGLIPWDFRQQRPQHLVRKLASLGYRILYLNPVCNNYRPEEVEKNIFVYSPLGYGTVIYNLKRGNEISLGRNIAGVIRELKFENSIVILNAPYWTPLLKYWEYSVLVYDCIDKYSEFEDLTRYEDWLSANEKKLLSLADLVLTSSQGLYHSKKKENKNTYLLPNGVDTRHFNYLYQPTQRPTDLPDYQLIIGYFGAVASWFDTDLIFELAKRIPEVGVVLIGEVSTDISSLTNLDNVFFLGEKPYQDLPDYLYYFDLTIIPFKKTELTSMTDPVKVYEYLAAGKPVLSTSLPELEKFRAFITMTKDKEEFIEKAKSIINKEKDETKAEERFSTVAKETWQNRAYRLKKLLHLAYYDLFLVEDELLENKRQGDSTIKEEEVKHSENKQGTDKSWLEKIIGWIRIEEDE